MSLSSTGFYTMCEDNASPILAVALHDGNEVRRDLKKYMAITAKERKREEDPFTGALAEVAASRLVVHRSRFEVDLNRPRDRALYLNSDDGWGMDLWKELPPEEVVRESLAEYDQFYRDTEAWIRRALRRHGALVVLDLHSYCHRRDGPKGPVAPPEENPAVNIGTESVPVLWRPLRDRFMGDLREQTVAGEALDVRENVKFRGGEFVRWLHSKFRGAVCGIAIEFKKTFMNEWTGRLRQEALDELSGALRATLPGLEESRAEVARRRHRRRSVVPAASWMEDASMDFGIVVNNIRSEEAGYTTVRLALSATNRGHKVWFMGVGDLALDSDNRVRARARRVPKLRYKTGQAFLADLQSAKAVRERITVDELDLLLLRNNPPEDKAAWAQSAGIVFGRVARRHGVIVLNDPNGLAQATNKMYFQLFPEEVRPKTLITRDRDEIKEFARDTGKIVLKPLQGSGGENVFLVRDDEVANLNQMIDAVTRDGYVIAQEYLPAAEEGDTRLFVMNGAPLRHKGRYAAFRRIRQGGDMRSNIHAGGTLAPAEVDARMLRIAEIVRPKLVQDGMFLVGLDIVGDKLMEINVFSPGGLGSAQKMENVNFSQAVVHALERKVQYNNFYGRGFDNVELATL